MLQCYYKKLGKDSKTGWHQENRLTKIETITNNFSEWTISINEVKRPIFLVNGDQTSNRRLKLKTNVHFLLNIIRISSSNNITTNNNVRLLTSCCKFVRSSVLAICINFGGSDCKLSTNLLKAKHTLSTLFWS